MVFVIHQQIRADIEWLITEVALYWQTSTHSNCVTIQKQIKYFKLSLHFLYVKLQPASQVY